MSDAEAALLAKAQIIAVIDELIAQSENHAHRTALLQQRNRVAKLYGHPVKVLKDYSLRKISSASVLAVEVAPS